MDAVAALRMWGYETTFPGVLGPDGEPWAFRIEPLPAASWIVASLQRDHLAYLPGLLTGGHRERMMDALEEGQITIDDLGEVNHDAIEVVSGWRWWEAGRLIGLVSHSYHTVGALLVLSGVDPLHTPLGAYLAAVYGRLWMDMDKKGRAKLAQTIAAPPATLLGDNFDEEAAEAAVRAFIAAGPTGHRET